MFWKFHTNLTECFFPPFSDPSGRSPPENTSVFKQIRPKLDIPTFQLKLLYEYLIDVLIPADLGVIEYLLAKTTLAVNIKESVGTLFNPTKLVTNGRSLYSDFSYCLGILVLT